MDNNDEHEEPELALMYDRQADDSQNWFEILAAPNAVKIKMYLTIENEDLGLPVGMKVKPEITMDYDATVDLATALIAAAAEAYRLDIDQVDPIDQVSGPPTVGDVVACPICDGPGKPMEVGPRDGSYRCDDCQGVFQPGVPPTVGDVVDEADSTGSLTTCPACGLRFVARGNEKYCSKGCWPGTKVITLHWETCPACGKRHQSRGAYYCSTACRKKGRRAPEHVDG